MYCSNIDKDLFILAMESKHLVRAGDRIAIGSFQYKLATVEQLGTFEGCGIVARRAFSYTG